jgi:MoaA/NifB/PqqE/SkfB family radical SAM enzyme
LEQFVELRTDTTLYIPPEHLPPYLVPDGDLGRVLTRFPVAGLRPAVSLGPMSPDDGLTVRYAGNLVDPTWLSMNIGGYCTSRCSFCYTELIRHRPALSSRQVCEAIDQASAIPSLRAMVFTGGEPTLRRDLPRLVEHARSRGFRRIGVQTNGHRTADRSYLVSLVEAGVTGILLSLHGATASTHDGITGVDGSFAMACQTLRAADDLGIDITVNHVLCRQNSAGCREFVELIDSISTRAGIRFSFLIIEGAASENLPRIAISLDDFIAAVAPAIRNADRIADRVEVANVPACVSDRLRARPAYLLRQRRELLQVSPFAQHSELRGERGVKLEPCGTCTWAADCDGVQIPLLVRFNGLSVYPAS